jgi:hypothetical protein
LIFTAEVAESAQCSLTVKSVGVKLEASYHDTGGKGAIEQGEQKNQQVSLLNDKIFMLIPV